MTVGAADFPVFSVGLQGQLEDYVQGPVDYAKLEETKKLHDLHKFDNGTWLEEMNKIIIAAKCDCF